MQFNAEQEKAILSTARNLLVLAGAGTGKTRTVVGRARYVLQQGGAPGRIAILTFTRRAATEIKHRLRSASAGQIEDVFAGTFHRFCLRIMSRHRDWFGFDDLTVMDRDDQLQLMKLVRSEVAGKHTTAPQAAQLITYYSYARNTNQATQEYLRKYSELSDSEQEVVLKVFDAYSERKRSRSYFDYDDILHRFAKVMHNDEFVAAKIAGRYDHVLVDEMQDTNPLQWLIIESLSKQAHLFCVGDDAQSIYAFRGADFRNVHSFEERLAESKTVKLEQNYRSTQPILDLANWLLAGSKLNYDKRLQAVRGKGEKPKLLEFNDEYEESEWVSSCIVDRRREGFAWNTNMILCRTAYSSRAVEAQLIEKKIPYRFVGGVGLLQMAHVRDLLAPLRLVNNHRDELAWMRFLTLWPRIGEVTASRALAEAVVQSSVDDAIVAIANKLPGRSEVTGLLSALVAVSQKPSKAVELAQESLEQIFEAKYSDWDRRKRDIALLAELAARHRSLAAFVETYTLDLVSVSEAENDRDEDIVTLITVHSAKGTEADVCYVIGAQSGNYPHTRSMGDPDSVEEERRVLYVALTRARDQLFITRTVGRGFSYRSGYSLPTSDEYFLECVPADLIESATVRQSPRRHMFDDNIV